MGKLIVKDSELTSVADAIRTKGGTSENLVFPNGMVSAIEALPTGGGDVDAIIKTLLGARLKYYAYGQITGFTNGQITFDLKSDYAFVSAAADHQGIAMSMSANSTTWNYLTSLCQINNNSASTMGVLTSMSGSGAMSGATISVLNQYKLRAYTPTEPTNLFFAIFEKNFSGTPTKIAINNLVTAGSGTMVDL